MAVTEHQIHTAVVEILQRAATPSCLWMHIPNGERRDERTGAKLKRMGVRAGAADLVAIVNGRTLFLELKRPGGKTSKTQDAFATAAWEAGTSYVVASSVKDAVDALMQHGAVQKMRIAA